MRLSLTGLLDHIQLPAGRRPLVLSPDAREARLMALTYQRNAASTYTTALEALGEGFDYSQSCDQPWLPEECSLLHGSPLWDEATQTQRLALNHLYWCCFYNMVAGAEVSAMVWNGVAAGAFWSHKGLEDYCHELDLETTQERFHIRAFEAVITQTERALFGEGIFGRERPHYTHSAVAHPQVPGSYQPATFIPGQLATAAIGSSPFVATQYFTARGLRNMAGKVKEGRFLRFGQGLAKAGATPPVPTRISENHFYDETFHTSTSQIISHELVNVVYAPSRWEAAFANTLIAGTQQPDHTISVTVPGMFRDDAHYMPFVYKMLRSRLFEMDHHGALELMSSGLCEEHAGFHTALGTLDRVREEGMKFLQGLDYLWPTNSELKLMAQASLPRALERNRAAFSRFKAGLLKTGEGRSPTQLPQA